MRLATGSASSLAALFLRRDRLVAGEGEEHLVERGPADAEVLDADARLVEPAQEPGRERGPGGAPAQGRAPGPEPARGPERDRRERRYREGRLSRQ